MTEGNSAFGEIVGGEFQSDLIARQDADAIAAEPACRMGQHDTLMFELHAEQAAGEFFQNRTGNFYAVLFTHKPPGFGWRTGQSEFRPAR
jgi:hypothetical protein